MFILLKAIVSALTILIITAVAKKTSLLGGLIAMMPINIILSLLWLHFENKDMLLLENFTKAALIGIIPTILFLVTVLYFLNKDAKLATALFAGICFLGCAAYLQCKLLKII